MAPYADLLRSMKPQDIHIVVTFLKEVMEEAESKAMKESAADTIKKKFKKLSISQETKELVNGLSLSEEEMEDERTQHILRQDFRLW